MNDDRSGTGKGGRPAKVTDKDIINIIRNHESDEVPLRDISDSVSISHSAMARKMRDLRQRDFVKLRDLGNGNPDLYSLKTTENDVLKSIDELDQNATPEEVANHLGVPEQVSLTWLRLLEEEDKLWSKPTGNSQRSWSRVD